MAANYPLLRPFGMAAGVLGSFQGLIWLILSLLGILAYTKVISWDLSFIPSNYFENMLGSMYFKPYTAANGDPKIMTPDTVVIWTSVYFAASVIWLVISGFMLHDSYTSKFTSRIIIGWVVVSAAVAAIDFAGTVAFGVDYNILQREVDKHRYGYEVLLPPIFMMTMCARGFILWIINVGLVIYLGVTARKLNKKESENLPHYPLRSIGGSSMRAKLRSPSAPTADPSSKERQNPGFQPDVLYAWDNQSPTVSNQQQSPWNYPENSYYLNDVVNPIQPHHVGKPVSPPVAPLPIPHPDYSPVMGRPVKHEPNLYDAPVRSALKKTNPTNPSGRTIF